MNFNLSFSSFWAQGDAVSHAVFILLVLMSAASWAIIIGKSISLTWMQHRNQFAVHRFWQAHDLISARHELKRMAPFITLVDHAEQAVTHYNGHKDVKHQHLDSHWSLSELVTRALRQGLTRATAELERGQVVLASIGSVSPFVGLFGTVWGIYHALAAIGAQGQASLDKVAGPVGEALIMTAIGLFVAIPAVLAYNAFNRSQRLILADVDGFAHDLLMFFTMGSPQSQDANNTYSQSHTPLQNKAAA